MINAKYCDLKPNQTLRFKPTRLPLAQDQHQQKWALKLFMAGSSSLRIAQNASSIRRELVLLSTKGYFRKGGAMRFTILIVSAVFTVLGADGGEISKRSYSRHFEWEPSDCYKPHPPAIYELDEFTQYQIEAYLSEVESYRTCIRTEGESDFSDANRKLAQAIEQGIDETLSEVDDDLRHLETSILLVE